MKLAEIVESLAELGYSEARIAKEIGCSQPTINRIRHGADARYTIASALVAFHNRAAAKPVAVAEARP